MQDAQESALFFQGKAKYERLLAAKKAADKALQDHGKVVKSEFGEHGLSAMKLAVRLATDDDAPSSIKARMDLELKVMRWMGMPVGSQASLFENDRRPADELAYEAGLRAGMEGKSMTDFGYDESNEHWQSAARGWHEGQERIFNIKPLDPTTSLVKTGKPADADAEDEPETDSDDTEDEDTEESEAEGDSTVVH